MNLPRYGRTRDGATRKVNHVKILITNYQLDHRTGTEIVVRDLERGLRTRGHEVYVYTPHPGVLSDEIVAAGGKVVTALDQVPFTPDVIHGHHNGPATEAALHFPSTPLIFVCHSRDYWLDIARGVPSVYKYVAVDLNCRERLLAEGVGADSIDVITNAADIDRFVVRRTPALGSTRKAAIFSNNAMSGNFVESVRRACSSVGLTLDVLGDGVGASIDDPERVLADYDVVFAKARCAIEAMAAGCAVLATDAAGYGGMVTPANVDWMLDWNVGDRCLQRVHDADAIAEDLRRIDEDDVQQVALRVRQRCSLRGALDAYEHLYRDAIAGERNSLSPSALSSQNPHDALTQYATELQATLRGDGSWSMPPLPPSIANGVGIRASAPRVVAPLDSFSLSVEIVNQTRESLATIGATPVRLSYHWLDATSGEIVEFEGVRTSLTRRVTSGVPHRQDMQAVAPAHAGTFTLRVTLVQETVMWFTDLPTPVFDDVAVVVGERNAAWSLSEIAALAALSVVRDATVSNLGFIGSPLPNMLTYATTPAFVAAAGQTGCAAVIVSPLLASLVPESLGLLVSEDPADAFRRIHLALVEETAFYGDDIASRIDPRAHIHQTATIGDRNVRIAADVVVGAGAVITGRVRIEVGAVISPGAVIGASGFQTIRVDGRPIELVHVGGIVIGEKALVFSNATVARGLFRQDTVLGADCRVGNNAFVSHNVQVGARSVVGHGAQVNGNVHVGADVWIGPGATISNNLTIGEGAHVDLGSTVIGNIAPKSHVGGAPAIDHRAVLREVATWRLRARHR